MTGDWCCFCSKPFLVGEKQVIAGEMTMHNSCATEYKRLVKPLEEALREDALR